MAVQKSWKIGISGSPFGRRDGVGDIRSPSGGVVSRSAAARREQKIRTGLPVSPAPPAPKNNFSTGYVTDTQHNLNNVW
jgi:hypothetical protein